MLTLLKLMNKEQLEKRLIELKTALDQIQANGNATIGAIAECEYWLKQLEDDKPVEEKKEI